MIKQTLYPKTKRLDIEKNNIVITEKLDGSNLGIFRLGDNLIIAQRNNVFTWNSKETTLNKQVAYGGLICWLDENGVELLEKLNDGSGLFGEWIGMGKIKYSDRINKRFYAFAKANISFDGNNFSITNLKYNYELFKYSFVEQNKPYFIGYVPIVDIVRYVPQKSDLDDIYNEYTENIGDKVEGFIVVNNDDIRKYVRFKNGKLTDHF